jgi:Tol biopolymer transport system component
MHRLNYFQYMSWSPDGRELLAGGNDGKGRQGIYKIDVETGATSIVVENGGGYVQWAPDGKSFYYKPAKGRDMIVKRDLASGVESELVRVPGGFFSLSPDAQSIAAVANQGETTDVVVIPLQGGQLRNVFHLNSSERLAPIPLSWTPDGRAVIAMKSVDGNSRTELWEVPIDGRQPRKLKIETTNWDSEGLHLSPDGKQIAFVGTAGKSGTEIWALENLSPPLRTNH